MDKVSWVNVPLNGLSLEEGISFLTVEEADDVEGSTVLHNANTNVATSTDNSKAQQMASCAMLNSVVDGRKSMTVANVDGDGGGAVLEEQKDRVMGKGAGVVTIVGDVDNDDDDDGGDNYEDDEDEDDEDDDIPGLEDGDVLGETMLVRRKPTPISQSDEEDDDSFFARPIDNEPWMPMFCREEHECPGRYGRRGERERKTD